MKILKTVSFALVTLIFFMSCKKEYSYEGDKSILSSGTWQFQNNAVQYNGNIDSASIQNVGGTKVLTLIGTSLNGQENFEIQLFNSSNFTATSYLASSSELLFHYSTSSNPKTIFTGDFSAGEFVVTITSLSNNIITGTFSGLVEDSTGAQTQITLGTFTSTIDLSNNGAQSVGILGANPDTCTPVTILGVYTTGIPLAATTNTVQVQVNVTSPGAFSIVTNSVNNVNFVKSGTFTTTGVQNVILEGSGIPQSAGVKYFTVSYGGSNCIFALTFLQGTVPTGDYFPTTITSNWAYGLEGGAPEDSLLTQVISYAPTIGGNVFTSFLTENIPPSGFTDTGYFRKSGNDYITYVDLSKVVEFDDAVPLEYIFLKDAVPVNTTYNSPNFAGTVLGVPITGHIKITITEKAVPVTWGALNFPDVIKVTYQYYVSILPTPAATEEKWFARGVGLIYEKLTDNINSSDVYIYQVGRYTVLP